MTAVPLSLADVGKFVALGHTFPSHRQYDRAPNWPILWTVPECSIIPEDEPIQIPEYIHGAVPGAELAVVIDDDLWQATTAQAREGIAGFTVSNDVRVKGSFPGYPYGELQEYPIGRGYHILPTFSPTLTRYVDLDPEDASELSVEIRIDGDTVFSGSTSEMDWGIIELVQHVSRIVRLAPGDIISLGDASDPTTYLEQSEVVECEIEEVGTLRNPIEIEPSDFPPT